MNRLENPYKILDIPFNSSIEDVKKAYKNIALKSHPDKLNNIKDINEKNKKIKEFMEATNAYNKIMNINNGDYNKDDDDDFNFDYNYDEWINTFNEMKESKLFKNVVNAFMNFKPKINKHNINVEIKLNDYFSPNKKKLRIFLKNVNEPIYINLDCKKYPLHVINYFDDNDNEHEITINMTLMNNIELNNGYYFNNENNNLYYDINIDTIDYILGSKKEFVFFNKEIIEVDIEPFSLSHSIHGKGINEGDLIINLKYNPIEKEKWENLNDANKIEMIRIFQILKNDIKI
jgi:DnaJ-class molecular chaperone